MRREFDLHMLLALNESERRVKVKTDIKKVNSVKVISNKVNIVSNNPITTNMGSKLNETNNLEVD